MIYYVELACTFALQKCWARAASICFWAFVSGLDKYVLCLADVLNIGSLGFAWQFVWLG